MYEFECPEPVTLTLKIAAGEADIVAEDIQRAVVEVTGADGSDASQHAADLTRVDLRGDTLVIDAPEAGGWGFRRNPRLRISVRLPRGGDLVIKTASADVRARGSFADAKLTSASGDVSIEHIAGDATVGTASGKIHLGSVDGGLHVKSASGALSVDRVGTDANVHSASGDLSIGYVGGSVNATTASGDVRLGAVNAGEINVKSASGDVTVGVTPGTGVWLDLITVSGDTRSDLEMSPGEPAAATVSLQVRTASGDIHVHRSATARVS